MAGLAKYVLWVWELSVAAQVVVCALLLVKRNFLRIPLFTAYIFSNIFQAAVLYRIYTRFGSRSWTVTVMAWSSQFVPELLRVLATTEVIRLILRPYRGIWALGWRVLAVAFAAVFSFALIDSWRNLFWAIALADRGFHLAFGIALVACLLLAHYYSIPIQPAYKALLGGLCFYSCTVVMANTIGRVLFLRGAGDFRTGWQLLTMGAFVAVLATWAVALRKPLPQPLQPELLPEAARTYWETSPRINARLRRLNEHLDHFWRPEATQS
ncbi:MAG TPA: hypothetical protein VI431_00100 [Candidatus Acidoferrum sp.]